jgi:hypothetical protein
MPLPTEIADWIARSEVDHVGPFVNAWAAFNAWYRYVSGKTRDADALDYLRTQPNVVRGAILPMLDPLVTDTPDAVAFKGAVAQLHTALEAFRLETLHDEKLEHVSFRSVPLRRGPSGPINSCYRTISYRVEKANRKYVSSVENAAGSIVARIEQDKFDLAALMADGAYLALSNERKSRLRGLYTSYDPRPMTDLLSSSPADLISAGTISFRCSCEDLFGAIIVTIYRMRNMLLHGELKPDRAALACYEPAYRLLRRMLHEIG